MICVLYAGFLVKKDEKIFKKNLEDKKKSVSLQPV